VPSEKPQLDPSERERIEALSKSDYFDFVVERAVEQRLASFGGRLRGWYLLIIALVTGLVGWNVFDWVKIRHEAHSAADALTATLQHEQAWARGVAVTQDSVVRVTSGLTDRLGGLTDRSERLTADNNGLVGNFIHTSAYFTSQVRSADENLNALRNAVAQSVSYVDSTTRHAQAEADEAVHHVKDLLAGIRSDSLLVAHFGETEKRLELLEAQVPSLTGDIQDAEQRAVNAINDKAKEQLKHIDDRRRTADLDDLKKRLQAFDERLQDLEKHANQTSANIPHN
jgi:hypothetical protein